MHLTVGTLVDKYSRDPYVVLNVNNDGDVYTTRPLLGGATQTVNRRLLVLDPRGEEPEDDSEVEEMVDLCEPEEHVRASET